MLEGIQALVPCNAVAYNVVTSRHDWLLGRAVGDRESPQETDPVRLDEVSDRMWTQTLPCTYTFRTRERTAIRRSTDWYGSAREYWTSPYGEWTKLNSGRFAVVVPVTQRDDRDHRVCLFRDEGRDFSDRELLLLRLLRPRLLELELTHQRRQRPPLTERQAQVLSLVADGLTNRQIARRLDLSEGTVRTHLMNAFELLGIHSRAAAASLMTKHEWAADTGSESVRAPASG